MDNIVVGLILVAVAAYLALRVYRIFSNKGGGCSCGCSECDSGCEEEKRQSP
ncbi:MAG: FeoB-associated Cys-rich membrane protein [Firmicutes bacterium]|nr:FeoB-associated Cys-rich membrane protein [Bacillota bacterium]